MVNPAIAGARVGILTFLAPGTMTLSAPNSYFNRDLKDGNRLRKKRRVQYLNGGRIERDETNAIDERVNGV